jgi:hypothetical protein
LCQPGDGGGQSGPEHDGVVVVGIGEHYPLGQGEGLVGDAGADPCASGST